MTRSVTFHINQIVENLIPLNVISMLLNDARYASPKCVSEMHCANSIGDVRSWRYARAPRVKIVINHSRIRRSANNRWLTVLCARQSLNRPFENLSAHPLHSNPLWFLHAASCPNEYDNTVHYRSIIFALTETERNDIRRNIYLAFLWCFLAMPIDYRAIPSIRNEFWIKYLQFFFSKVIYNKQNTKVHHISKNWNNTVLSKIVYIHVTLFQLFTTNCFIYI